MERVVSLVENGLGRESLECVFKQYSAGLNNEINVNKASLQIEFSSASEDSAPYSIDEETLRAAIYMRDTFTYGNKKTVILLSGTATKGGLCNKANLAKLILKENYAENL